MPDVPRVLLLGDSIRISYQPHVARLLDGWIAELGRPDIVHWNNGIHDAGHNPVRDPVQIPIDVYRATLESILGRLTALTPNVIWATSTPVHPARPFGDTGWAWRNEEIDQYNDVARDLMESRGVPINDLHTLVWDNMAEYLCEDQLHLSDAGQEACAEAVASCISTVLP